jgi:uncharacterized integral membrane protein
MNIRSLTILVLLALLGVFAVVNWGTFISPTELSLVFTRVEAPLGLIMLGFTALLTVVFLGYVMFVQMSALSASRKHSEELRHQRELADRAEASRFTELRQFLAGELEGLRKSQLDSEGRLRDELASTANSLAASIGELDERVERMAPTPPERQP